MIFPCMSHEGTQKIIPFLRDMNYWFVRSFGIQHVLFFIQINSAAADDDDDYYRWMDGWTLLLVPHRLSHSTGTRQREIGVNAPHSCVCHNRRLLLLGFDCIIDLCPPNGIQWSDEHHYNTPRKKRALMIWLGHPRKWSFFAPQLTLGDTNHLETRMLKTSVQLLVRCECFYWSSLLSSAAGCESVM